MSALRRSRIVLAVFAVLALFGIGLGVSALTSSNNSAAPSSSASPTVKASPTQIMIPNDGSTPEPVESALAPDGPLTLPTPAPSYKAYGWATVGSQMTVGYPAQWSVLIGPSDGTKIVNFSDHSKCPTEETACPPVTFQDITGEGSAPLQTWEQRICPGGTSGGAEGPVDYKMAGADAQFYSYPCDGVDNFAWITPGQILVTTSDNGSYAANPSLVEAALDQATWR